MYVPSSFIIITITIDIIIMITITISVIIMICQVTHSRHYESFRASKLQEMMRGVGGKVGVMAMEYMTMMIMINDDDNDDKIA